MINSSRILIVDDNPKNIQLAANTLHETGAELAFAMSGEEAIAALDEISVHLILMDVVMPGMDGFETVRRIKDNNEYAEIPVIFLTAHNDQKNISKGFDVGGVDYVSKPFHHQELIARVMTHLELNQSRQALKRELHFKEKLLRELYHRVKNNLQVISGFLSLQASHYDEPLLTSLLHESNLRIRAMARVHEQLYLADDPTCINMQRYLEDLIRESLRLHADTKPAWSLHAEELELPVGYASVIGLIVNEILSNAFKHAFCSVSDPKITFTFWRDATVRKIGLSVTDNGRAAAVHNNDTSLGMDIIEALTHQLNGDMQLQTEEGYQYRILFPEESLLCG